MNGPVCGMTVYECTIWLWDLKQKCFACMKLQKKMQYEPLQSLHLFFCIVLGLFIVECIFYLLYTAQASYVQYVSCSMEEFVREEEEMFKYGPRPCMF